MDIDYIVETRCTIAVDKIEINNENIQIFPHRNYQCLSYYGEIFVFYDEINADLIIKGIDGLIDLSAYDALVLIFFIELSDTCRRKLTQKFYNKVSEVFTPVWVNMLNLVIMGNDIGIIIKEKNITPREQKLIDCIRMRRKI